MLDFLASIIVIIVLYNAFDGFRLFVNFVLCAILLLLVIVIEPLRYIAIGLVLLFILALIYAYIMDTFFKKSNDD